MKSLDKKISKAMQKKTPEKILRHKPATRQALKEISEIITPENAFRMKLELAKLTNEQAFLVQKRLEKDIYDNWFFYTIGVNFNSECRTICYRYLINHYQMLEKKRVAELGGPF